MPGTLTRQSWTSKRNDRVGWKWRRRFEHRHTNTFSDLTATATPTPTATATGNSNAHGYRRARRPAVSHAEVLNRRRVRARLRDLDRDA